MKSYYIHQGGRQQGPYSIDQLKTMRIGPTTQVWTEGLPEWTPAKKINELQTVLFLVPPPFIAAHSKSQDGYAETTVDHGLITSFWKTGLMIIGFILLVFLLLKWQG